MTCSARQELVAVGRIPQCCRTHRARTHDIQLAILLHHAGQDLAGQFDFGRRQLSFPEDRLAQTYHLPVRRQHLHRLRRIHFRRQHPDGIAADIDRCVTGHVSGVS
jgi:hypothetical protein